MAVCDAWVTKNIEKRTGVYTPVYRLYNAYIQDNPGDYMDIGQVKDRLLKFMIC